MTKETESLDADQLQGGDLLELGRDHNGVPTWYLSTREGWQEAGEEAEAGAITMLPVHYAIGSQLQLFVPIGGARARDKGLLNCCDESPDVGRTCSGSVTWVACRVCEKEADSFEDWNAKALPPQNCEVVADV